MMSARKNSAVIVLLIIISVQFGIALCGETKAPSEDGSSRALPLDVAFSRKQIRTRDDVPTLSSDKYWLAYEIFSQPINGEDTNLFLANGTPTLARGLHL